MQNQNQSESPSQPESEKPKQNNGEVVFWSRAERCHLGGFSPEVRDGSGRISQREGAIKFNGHILVTDNPKVIAFVRSHNAFEAGDVRECEDTAEARKFTAQRNVLRYKVTTEEAAFEESVVIKSPAAQT